MKKLFLAVCAAQTAITLLMMLGLFFGQVRMTPLQGIMSEFSIALESGATIPILIVALALARERERS
jgi:hypothetical protein